MLNAKWYKIKIKILKDTFLFVYLKKRKTGNLNRYLKSMINKRCSQNIIKIYDHCYIRKLSHNECQKKENF